MNFTGLIFIFITYAVLKSMIIADVDAQSITIEAPSLPSLDLNVTFNYVSIGGIDAIADAIHNLYITIAGIAQATVALVVFLYDLIVYLVQLFLFITVNAFTGFDGAPWYINTITATPAIVMVGIIGYKLLRSGSDEE